mmetsp:Transcript_21821/g.30761  ORF Transcript_21821/g.30761 Transcript_21821/m.30761 type:complete len:422 (+) Transcript_21821:12-1277(+)
MMRRLLTTYVSSLPASSSLLHHHHYYQRILTPNIMMHTKLPTRNYHLTSPCLLSRNKLRNSKLLLLQDDNNMINHEDDEQQQDEFPIVLPTNGVPIHLYTNDIEPDALNQLTILAESPVPVDYVSVMPDVHVGKGVTIGTVFASEDYICPNAVGVDIGCGMAAIPIDNLYKWDLSNDDKVQIQAAIKDRIPTGFNQHAKTLQGTKETITEIIDTIEPSAFLKNQLVLPRVTDQLGTLGGGNHFLEIVHEETSGQVWIMLHSGSRNIGNRVAQHYDQVAKEWLSKGGGGLDAVRRLNGLHYMPIDSREGQEYLKDMEWCQKYAFHNRRVMKEIMLDIVQKVTGREADLTKSVNIHHNYCACEKCGRDERKLYITRKGATSAKVGEMGIIPGSMVRTPKIFICTCCIMHDFIEETFSFMAESF